jgi:hypothetical protein
MVAQKHRALSIGGLSFLDISNRRLLPEGSVT